MRSPLAIVVPLAASLLTSCSLTRTHYNRPNMPLSATYEHADANARASIDQWWRSFSDTNLNALIDEVLKKNSDLALADLNVRIAQLQTHLAIINPIVSVGYAYDYSKPVKGAVAATQFHSLTALASYEPDLWDQLGALEDVARWEARATQQDRQSAALALVGAAVNLYFQLAYLNYRVTLGEQSIAYAAIILQLVEVRKAAGGASQLEVAEAEQSLGSQKASQVDLIEQRVEIRSELTVLLSGTSWPQSAERLAVPEGPPPSVAAGLPSSLLDRRPDLRAAELRLRETLAQTDATRLSFYPNFALTGSLGTASTGLTELVSNPLGSVAAALSVPLVQLNQARFATKVARTLYDKAAVSFRKTFLQALIDVDNALSARAQLANEAIQLEHLHESAKTAERLYQVRYRAGAVGLQAWLDAHQSRQAAEIALAANRLSRLQNYASLCQALGGDADHL
jgi:NodT family efflux transporter outer membrane factor (OMF) lipoprotein